MCIYYPFIWYQFGPENEALKSDFVTYHVKIQTIRQKAYFYRPTLQALSCRRALARQLPVLRNFKVGCPRRRADDLASPARFEMW